MNKFKVIRDATGMKQVCAASKLGVSQSTISMWENGENYPRAELLPKIASLYGCTVDELLICGAKEDIGE